MPYYALKLPKICYSAPWDIACVFCLQKWAQNWHFALEGAFLENITHVTFVHLLYPIKLKKFQKIPPLPFKDGFLKISVMWLSIMAHYAATSAKGY